jgi:hypothetical protein
MTRAKLVSQLTFAKTLIHACRQAPDEVSLLKGLECRAQSRGRRRQGVANQNIPVRVTHQQMGTGRDASGAT